MEVSYIDAGAIGQLLLAPAARTAPKGFQQMVKAAVALGIRGMRGPDRVGHGVVDVAAVCGFVTARPSTGQIPAPHEIGQLS
jgi:hypothetical protein